MPRPRSLSVRLGASGLWARCCRSRTDFGRKYTVPGSLVGTKGALAVLTVWIQEPRREDVRLVTVLPRSL